MNFFEKIEANNGKCLECKQDTLVKRVLWGIEFYQCTECGALYTKLSCKYWVKSPDFKHAVWKV